MAVSDSTDVPTPDPLREEPPCDRFCDLVLNGGVASGVVYPWALVGLARHYRFRRIGGNSVGAIAAALAAAAEYGRCLGHENAFEPLRQAPLALAEERMRDGEARTGMLRLFQPGAGLHDWFEMGLIALRALYEKPGRRWRLAALRRLACRALRGDAVVAALSAAAVLGGGRPPWSGWLILCAGVACAAVPLLFLVAVLIHAPAISAWLVSSSVALLALAFGTATWQTWHRGLSALRRNGWGLCSGRSMGTEEAIVEWLHRGIQRAANREEHAEPLTFADLWAARPDLSDGPGIDLQMFSTLVSLGRPVRWPRQEGGPRLFFDPDEWSALFPPRLLKAVVAAAKSYDRTSDSDPPPDAGDDAQRALKARLKEIPVGELPIAVAARLSMSFPLLFSCVPVYAIAYDEKDPRDRTLHRAWMTDGGLCTNFPIHLFDAAHPRWPTFGLMLSRRIPEHQGQAVWLPDYHRDGRADNWDRGVPDAPRPAREAGSPPGLFGLLLGMALTTMNWSDALTSRLPHVRNRVLRMALRDDEGQLNLLMPKARILSMAHHYGSAAAKELLDRFGRAGEPATQAWREHVYVRAMNELRSLSRHLRGYAAAVASRAKGPPLDAQLAAAAHERPLRQKTDDQGRPRPDPAGESPDPREAAALREAVEAIATLEQALACHEAHFGPYQPEPAPDLALRAPL